MRRLQKWPWQRVLTLGLSLKARIIVGTLLPVAAIGLYFIRDLATQRQLERTTHDILDRRIITMHAAEQIKEALVAYDDALFRYLAVQDPAQLREEARRKQETEESLNQLSDLSSSPVLHSRLMLLKSESEQYFQDAEKLVDFSEKSHISANVLQQRSSAWSRDTGREHLELAFLSAEGKARLVRVFSLCEEIITVNRLELERAQEDMNRVLSNAHRTGLALCLLAMSTLTILASGFILSLLSPLRNLLNGIRQMQEGDLAVEIPVTTEDEVGELTQAFNEATQIIREQREQLLKETITDGLTGAYNQRHFRQLLRQEVERAHRSGDPISLLMMDVDHFKEYNDMFGHEFGNEALKKVSHIVRETVREIDILARYGGDEFAVILPRADALSAKALSQRILDAVAAYGSLKSELGQTPPKLSVSIGGASYPKDGNSAESLIHKADEALYAAKHAGRDRFHWASPTDGTSPLEVSKH